MVIVEKEADSEGTELSIATSDSFEWIMESNEMDGAIHKPGPEGLLTYM